MLILTNGKCWSLLAKQPVTVRNILDKNIAAISSPLKWSSLLLCLLITLNGQVQAEEKGNPPSQQQAAHLADNRLRYIEITCDSFNNTFGLATHRVKEGHLQEEVQKPSIACGIQGAGQWYFGER